MQFSPSLRRAVLLAHVTTSVGLIGAVAAFLTLAILGATTTTPALAQASYVAMAAITWLVILPIALAALLIGIVQSLGTAWGLFLHYWVILKLVLTILSVLVLAVQLATINALSAAALSGTLAGTEGGQHAMILHSTGGVVVLILIALLSIYKPHGTTSKGKTIPDRTKPVLLFLAR